MLGGYRCCSTIRVTDVGIVRVCPEELHFINQEFDLTGEDINTGPGVASQVGTELPDVDRLAKRRS